MLVFGNLVCDSCLKEHKIHTQNGPIAQMAYRYYKVYYYGNILAVQSEQWPKTHKCNSKLQLFNICEWKFKCRGLVVTVYWVAVKSV